MARFFPVVWFALLPLVAHARAGESTASLSAAIDAALAKSAADAPLAEPASDAEFLRRVSLDFAGVIPTPDEVRQFLADPSPQKRTQLVDRLLDRPTFPRRLAEAFSVMLLERREGKAVTDDAWQNYLRESFAAKKPWDELVRELVLADGLDDRTRPAIRFFVDGGRTDPHVLTQDVARLFLGMNWQCSQCHDHPAIAAYKQTHYYGLLAFLGQGKLVTDKQSRPFLRESVLKAKLEFVSVFHPNDKRMTGPRLLDTDELAIPTFAAGEDLATPAKDGLPGIPKFEPRKELAQPLTSHRQFARNAVNRFWFLLMGRGLVHPLDLFHPDNPPSHPELLERLTDDFIAQHYDVRWLMRSIALSTSYARSSRLPGDAAPRPARRVDYRAALLRPLVPEQLARSLAEALGQRAALDAATTTGAALTYKDYANGRTPLPTQWRDVFTVVAGAFGQPAGTPEVDFAPSVEQSVFLAHDRLVRDWLTARPGSLLERLLRSADSDAADELYLALLSRPASAAERDELVGLLKDAGEKRLETLQDICLALITSTEFRMNH